MEHEKNDSHINDNSGVKKADKHAIEKMIKRGSPDKSIMEIFDITKEELDDLRQSMKESKS